MVEIVHRPDGRYALMVDGLVQWIGCWAEIHRRYLEVDAAWN